VRGRCDRLPSSQSALQNSLRDQCIAFFCPRKFSPHRNFSPKMC
jgi:hypothetical protein